MYNATDGHGAGLQRGGNAMPGKQKGQVVNRPHGNNKVAEHFRKYYQLWLLALPGIALTLMFAYIPMSGLVIIFKDYNFKDGIFGSPWVGLKNFEFFFANFSNAWRATKNTIILNLFYTVFGTVAAVGLCNYVQRDSSQEIPQGQPVAVDHALLYFMGSGRWYFKSTAQLQTAARSITYW